MTRCFGSIGAAPRVHESAHADQSAQVIGDVEIGAESSVWMNVVIRGDVHRIHIGKRSNIQDGTVVHVMRGTHATTIGDDVTIGHAALVHGCTLADRILIGMGAILLNGVDVGEDSIVAAGTLIPERTQIPPRSLVMEVPVRSSGPSPPRKWRRSSNTPSGRRLPPRLHAGVMSQQTRPRVACAIFFRMTSVAVIT